MIFSNGLPVGTGLKIQHPTPVDDRLHVATSADLASLPYKYNGLSCRVANEDNRLYVYNLATDTWSAEDIVATETIAVVSTLNSRSLNVITQQSITSDTSGVKFVNDATSPGNNKVYGTNNSGVKGWRDLSLQHFAESTSVFSTRTFNRWEAIGASSDISLVLSPKGNGSISLQVPDGTSLGGNARGNKAVDLQCTRNLSTQVASGPDSFAATANSTAGGTQSAAFCGGITSATQAFSAGGIASGVNSFAGNSSQNTASGVRASAFGRHAIIAGENSFGVGTFARSDIPNAFIFGSGVNNNTSAYITTSMFKYVGSLSPEFPFSIGTSFELKNISNSDIMFDNVGGAAGFVAIYEIDYIVNGIDAGTNFNFWSRKVILTINNQNLIASQNVVHDFRTSGYVGATIVESIATTSPRNSLRITFTPTTDVRFGIQAIIKSHGVFLPA